MQAYWRFAIALWCVTSMKYVRLRVINVDSSDVESLYHCMGIDVRLNKLAYFLPPITFETHRAQAMCCLEMVNHSIE